MGEPSSPTSPPLAGHLPTAASPPRDPPGYAQHRCHARLADAVYALGSLQPSLLPSRVSLLFRCYASAPGTEPTDLYLLDPEAQRIQLKDPAAGRK